MDDDFLFFDPRSDDCAPIHMALDHRGVVNDRAVFLDHGGFFRIGCGGKRQADDKSGCRYKKELTHWLSPLCTKR